MNSRSITTDRLLEAVPDDPTPLAVSTASKTKLGVIHLRFTKADGVPDVECTRITVTLPVGDTDTDLTSNPGNIDYKHSSSGRNWSINPSGDRATYVCTPSGPGGKFVFTDTAHFTLILNAIPVGRLPGEASLALTASATTSTMTNQPDEEDWTVPITKAVDDFFFFRAFSCEQPQIPNNGTATLRWEGSEHETEYWLSYDGRDPQQVTGQSAQIAGITDTTTFVLDARTPNPDTKEFDQHHYLSTTVTVKEPTIVAKELTAKRINVPQTLTADSSNKTTTLHGRTTFEEDVTVMAQLIVNGTITNEAGTVQIEAGSGNITSSGIVQGGSLKAGTTYGIANNGAITGSGLNAGTGNITTDGIVQGGSLKAGTTYGIANNGAITGSSLNAGSGNITTSGTVSDNGEILRFGTMVVIRNQYHSDEGLNEDNATKAYVSLKKITNGNARWRWYLERPQ
ncbi:hypothetical protein [Streptomyces noursei]|uniref:Uncharacterized protein n=1 Tax=Streptomyces noursei TaxID=1971 RepID=A0A2N8PAV2_STRNR|nr:hypothetical protein [Streptomyces noursei]PNE38145.1 hypothetical protein AOB60_28960 [Streptomyces noursei]